MLGMRRAVAAALAASAALAFAAVPTAAAAGPTEVVVIVPISVLADADGLVSAETLARDTAPGGVLARQLDAVAGSAATVALDPLLLASIRVLGSQAPASATAWLERLDGLGNDVIPLPFALADLTLATQAGATRVPSPPDLAAALDPALFTDSASTATPAPDPNAALPTTDELLAWDWAATPVWPRTDSVVAADLPVLAADGAPVLLSSGNVSGTTANAIATVGDARAVIVDDAASTALTTAVSASTEGWPTAMSSLVSTLSAAGGVVVATAGSPATSAPRLGDTLGALASSPGVTVVPFSRALDGDPSPLTLVDEPQDAARVDVARRLLEAEAAEERFATVAENPAAITAPRRLELLGLLGWGWVGRDAAWSTATDEYLADSLDLRSAVRVVEASGFNLLADSAALPIAVSNDLDQTVTVYLTVKPATGILAVTDPRVELVIPPNSQARGQVPVQAISNGSVSVTISLASAAGVPISSTTTAEINVQAGWETPIVVVLAAIVVATFGVGLARNILRRRRAGSAA